MSCLSLASFSFYEQRSNATDQYSQTHSGLVGDVQVENSQLQRGIGARGRDRLKTDSALKDILEHPLRGTHHVRADPEGVDLVESDLGQGDIGRRKLAAASNDVAAVQVGSDARAGGDGHVAAEGGLGVDGALALAVRDEQ